MYSKEQIMTILNHFGSQKVKVRQLKKRKLNCLNQHINEKSSGICN
jgi:hypothetical protein